MMRGLLIVLMVLLVPVVQAQRFEWPTKWVGIVATSISDDGNAVVVTIDREGGTFDEKPGMKPDGVVDWVFVMTHTAARPPNLSGPATLRMPEGRATELEYIEISPADGRRRPVMFRAGLPQVLPDPVSVESFGVCRVIRLYPAWGVIKTHEETARRILDQVEWNNTCK